MSVEDLYLRSTEFFGLIAIARRATPEFLKNASAQAASKYDACPKITPARSVQSVKHRNPAFGVIEVT